MRIFELIRPTPLELPGNGPDGFAGIGEIPFSSEK